MARPRKLTLDFFIHDAGARSDRKIRLLRKHHHNDGYATYFCLLEMMCQEEGMRLQLGDPMNDEFVADECGLRDMQQLYSIIETCCKLGLLDQQLWQSERIIFSPGLYRRYIARMDQRRRDAARKGTKAGKAIADALEAHIQSVEQTVPESQLGFSAQKTTLSDRNPAGKPRDTESESRIQNQNTEPEKREDPEASDFSPPSSLGSDEGNAQQEVPPPKPAPPHPTQTMEQRFQNGGRSDLPWVLSRTGYQYEYDAPMIEAVLEYLKTTPSFEKTAPTIINAKTWLGVCNNPGLPTHAARMEVAYTVWEAAQKIKQRQAAQEQAQAAKAAQGQDVIDHLYRRWGGVPS